MLHRSCLNNFVLVGQYQGCILKIKEETEEIEKNECN